jgi:hypothetical protein
MATYLQFQTEDGSTVIIEVDSTETVLLPVPGEQTGEVQATREGKLVEKVEGMVQSAQHTFDEALNIVKSNARSFINKIRELSDPPDEVEMSFGLKATGELGGAFVVAKVGVEASYNVKLTWSRDKTKEQRSKDSAKPS